MLPKAFYPATRKAANIALRVAGKIASCNQGLCACAGGGGGGATNTVWFTNYLPIIYACVSMYCNYNSNSKIEGSDTSLRLNIKDVLLAGLPCVLARIIGVPRTPPPPALSTRKQGSIGSHPQIVHSDRGVSIRRESRHNVWRKLACVKAPANEDTLLRKHCFHKVF